MGFWDEDRVIGTDHFLVCPCSPDKRTDRTPVAPAPPTWLPTEVFIQEGAGVLGACAAAWSPRGLAGEEEASVVPTTPIPQLSGGLQPISKLPVQLTGQLKRTQTGGCSDWSLA